MAEKTGSSGTDKSVGGAMMQVRSPLKYSGGKFSSAERIIQAFPPPHCYDLYCEPCAGALHVLFAKPPYGHQEVIGDLDGNLITFWQHIRDNAKDMQLELDSLPYARQLYYAYHESLFDGESLTPLDRAVRYFYVIRMAGTAWLRDPAVGWNCHHEALRAFRSAIEMFQAAKERLKYVAIDNRDVLATIKRYDSPRTLFYIDPPYIDKHQYYPASRDGFDHVSLAKMLNQARGYVALSYYPHGLLDQLYPADKWRCMEWHQQKNTALKLDGKEREGTEILLMNYSPNMGGLFDERTNP